MHVDLLEYDKTAGNETCVKDNDLLQGSSLWISYDWLHYQVLDVSTVNKPYNGGLINRLVNKQNHTVLTNPILVTTNSCNLAWWLRVRASKLVWLMLQKHIQIFSL